MKRSIVFTATALVLTLAGSSAFAGVKDVVQHLKKIQAMGQMGVPRHDLMRESLELKMASNEAEKSGGFQSLPEFDKQLKLCISLLATVGDSDALVGEAFKFCGKALDAAPKTK